MTHFEYIFVAVSIILSFTILRLLDAVPSAFSRERGDWVHAVWVAHLLWFCAAFWWINWINRNLDALTFRYFLFLLLAPSILYLTATALVSASPAAVPAWRDHFESNRRRFFVGALVYLALHTINSTVTFGVPLWHPLRAGQATMFGLFAAGALVRSRRGQTVIAGLGAAWLLAALTAVMLARDPMSLE
jgi:hypothetical protein